MNATRIAFDGYLHALRKIPIEDKTEHTDRGALETLLNAVASEARAKVKIQHEPKHIAEKGAPDFKVTKAGSILGYVGNKQIGVNLDQVLKSDQIKRYRSLSPNILLTDYLQFIWIDRDSIKRETLCHGTDLEGRKFRARDDRIEAVAGLIAGFLSTAPEGIGRAQTLALALATRSHILHDFLAEELVRQQANEGPRRKLFGLYEVFKETLAEFADAFAQTLAYGLFLARLNAKPTETITLHNAKQFVPSSFRLIRELVAFLDELTTSEYRDIRWVVEEILSIVNGLDLAAIHEDLAFKNRKRGARDLKGKGQEEWRLSRDPFVYFYEDYLAKYDAKLRKSRGVYYTPPPIVNFIVRAIDDILKEGFGIKRGLADHKRVTVLDFATGTGTFLVEVFERIFETIGADSGQAPLIVRDHILKNIYGFEYLIAPYTIAHLKLSQYLEERGHKLKEGERLQVFLTNTLEPVEPQATWLLPALTEEVKAAQKVKDKPILVITGNPPYSGHSKNKGAWITASISEYKYTLETNSVGLHEKKPLGKKNPKWLNDDYVKFIRFAQMKMDSVDEGVVGIITNHSWVDNPTFRGMRQSLMRSFEQIYVLDLHGNAKKKEHAPDGGKDENVFDIEQGVAISLFVKRKGLERGVWRGDLWGKRLEKYRTTAESTLGGREWLEVRPVAPFFLFTKQDALLRDEYAAGWRLPEVFLVNVLGFQTHRDEFAVSFTETEMKRKLAELANPKILDDALARQYGLSSNMG